MKRWMPFLLIICVVLLLPAVSLAARAADTSGTCGDNLTWTFDEATGTLTIQGTGPMWDWDGAYATPWYRHRTAIKCMTISNGITTIGDSAFCGCDALTLVTIPTSVTTIGEWAFEGCTSLTEVTIPNGVVAIEERTFAECQSLSQVIIPNSVTSIGWYAFYRCTSLTEVTIPDSVSSIGDNAFGYCISLIAISVDEANAQYCSVNGVLFDKPQTTLIQYPAKKQGNIYIIPDCVTVIGDSAFAYCGSLTEVSIPDSVTVIGDSAFSECDSLTQVTIPNSVFSIGEAAFNECDSLTQMIIPDGVSSIGAWAFGSCDRLIQVTISKSVSSIGDNAFTYCTSLIAITVDEANPLYCSVSGVLFDKPQMMLIKYPAKKQGNSYIIPDCITTIEEHAFSECDSLTQVTIPNSVTSIGWYAFYRCTSLIEVTIPDSITSIKGWTFLFCDSLTQITIPGNVTYIGDQAFFGCSNLTDVYYKGTSEQWSAITVSWDNDPLLNATIHFAFDPETGAVFIRPLPEGAENALIAAYGDGKLLCTVTGQVGNENYISLANQPDEIRIFYLGGNYQPVTAPDIIPLD